MTLEVLLSAMHLDSYHYIDSLNITGNCVIINQCNKNKQKTLKEETRQITYIETTERGLSKSRNKAIKNATSDICIFCDNDVEYQKNYEQLILEEYQRHPEYDIIIFHIESKVHPVPCYSSARRLSYLTCGKIFSPEISFRRKSIQGIWLNERIGAGTKYLMGEENAFLYECLRQGLKIYYVPKQIAKLRYEPSTWDTGFNARFFIARGASFEAMTAHFSLLLIFQYAIRKYKLYKTQMSLVKAARYMIMGRKAYRKEAREETGGNDL